MPEIKADINQLFKSGRNFQLKETDYSTEKKREEIKELNQLRDEVRKSAEVDLAKLKNTVFRV
ncbi:MAG TPA: hypothetical protein VIM55_04915 [Mucilaginibacter sp.]